MMPPAWAVAGAFWTARFKRTTAANNERRQRHLLHPDAGRLLKKDRPIALDRMSELSILAQGRDQRRPGPRALQP